MSEQLRVVAAAIIGSDGKVYQVPAPGRHHDVIRHMIHEKGHKKPVCGIQGFVLSNGEFIEREAAKIIANMAGQVIPNQPHGNQKSLYSEDLW